VKLPFFPVTAAAGKKNTSVPIVPVLTLRARARVSLSKAQRFPIGKNHVHEPFKIAQSFALETRIRRPIDWVWPTAKVAFNVTVRHVDRGGYVRGITSHFRKVAEAEIIIGSGGIAVPGFEKRDYVLRKLRPPACAGGVAFDIFGNRCIDTCFRHRQIGGQKIEQRGDVGRALNRGVTAQSQNAAAEAADVAAANCKWRPCG
jgi:hypothetical protein